MIRARAILVAVLMLTVPVHAVAAITSDLCIAFGDHEADVALAHDHADHGHAGKPDSDTVHCAPCATAFIPAAPKLCLAAVFHADVVGPSASVPDSAAPRRIDRPPLAL